MKFSIRVQYGLQAVLELALNFGGGPVQIGEIADSQKIPVRFLEQILLALKRGGLVASSRGKMGGYALAKKPSAISVLSVIEILDGPVELASKKMKKFPALFSVFENIQEKLKSDFASATLENLAIKKRQEDRDYTYNI